MAHDSKMFSFFDGKFAIGVIIVLILILVRKRMAILKFILQRWHRKRQREVKALVEKEDPNVAARPTMRMLSAFGDDALEPVKFGRIRLPPGVKQQNFDDLRSKFVTRSNDVFVVAYPKSGTTWTQQIVKLVRNSGVEDGKNLDEAIPWLDLMTLEETEALDSPRAFKTHFPVDIKIGGEIDQSPAKYIYIYRNPKDTAVSFFHFAKGYLPYLTWNMFFDRFLTGKVFYGFIADHILGWYAQRDFPNVLILCYEDMHKNLRKEVERIATFLGFDLSPEKITSIVEQCQFKTMKKNPAANMAWTDKYRSNGTTIKFMRKGKIGDWRDYFSDQQSASLDEKIEKKMSGCDIKFQYGEE